MLDQIILITALEKWCPGELNSGRGGDVISLRTGDSVKTSQGASRGKGAPRGAVSCTGWRLKTNSSSLTRADPGGTAEGQFFTKELVCNNSKIQIFVKGWSGIAMNSKSAAFLCFNSK